MKLHKEGKTIILVSLAVWVIAAVLVCHFSDSAASKWIWCTVFAIVWIITTFFFRIPDRDKTVEEGIVVAPSDGKVVKIKKAYVSEYFEGECTQISIFLNLFNVHVTWFPVGGNVSFYRYHPGKYLFAFLPKSSVKNEHTTIVVKDNQDREVMFRQIAGIIARRIVCYVKEGEDYAQSSEAGIIKFGSRLDIFIPGEAEILVSKGDKVKGSVSAIARLK